MGEVRHVPVLVALGIGMDGWRGILGVVEGPQEDQESWRPFLTHLKGRGLTGVQLIVSDRCVGLVEAAAVFSSDARWQRCMVRMDMDGLKEVQEAEAAMADHAAA